MLGRPFSYIDPCFESITAQIVEFNSANCTISFTTSAKKSETCSSFYNINTREGGFFLDLNRANHVVNVTKALQEYEYDDISNFGWMVFYWPLGISGTIESIANTVLLFVGPEMIRMIFILAFLSSFFPFSHDFSQQEMSLSFPTTCSGLCEIVMLVL